MSAVETHIGSFEISGSQTMENIVANLAEEKATFAWQYESQARIEIGTVEQKFNHVNVIFPQYHIVLSVQNTTQEIGYQDWKLQFDHKNHQIGVSFSKVL
jgi:hypothetical protein